MKQMVLVLGCLFGLIFGIGLQVQQGEAAESFEEISTPDMLYVRGLIGSVSLEKMQISVRPPKDKRIVITVVPDTILEGFKGLDQLAKKQQVKVWYESAGTEHRAVKIKKLMELGC